MLFSLIGVFATALTLLVTVLCAYGVIPLNRWVGLRTSISLRSPEIWRSVHLRAIIPIAVTTVIIVGCWLLYPAGMLNDTAAGTLGLVILVAGLLWGVVRGTSEFRGRER